MTMKKSGLILLIVLFFALNTYAQFRVAPAGGVNSSSVKETMTSLDGTQFVIIIHRVPGCTSDLLPTCALLLSRNSIFSPGIFLQ
jgi:hypothetical protein